MKINRVKSLNGEITIPGDKSISHRSIMFGSIADGITEVHGFLNGADCISSMNCFRQMGIDIDYDGSVVTVHGKGLHGRHTRCRQQRNNHQTYIGYTCRSAICKQAYR